MTVRQLSRFLAFALVVLVVLMPTLSAQISFNAFMKEWNERTINYPGGLGGQCMDLMHQYILEVLGFDALHADTAYHAYLAGDSRFDKIPNTPTGVPRNGDLVFWNTSVGDGSGHVAVFIEGDVNRFSSFDQNWPVGHASGIVPHNYNLVVGWLRPKSGSGYTLPVITSFNITTPHSTTVGTQLVATITGNAGSNPLSAAALLRTTDLSGNSGWTSVSTQAVSGSFVNVSLNDTPPVGTFLYGAHLIDNTGQYGAEPSKVQVTVTQPGGEIASLTAQPQQASWVYYLDNSQAQWYISNSSGSTYLLSGASGYTGELVWGGIANGNPVATVNYSAKTVYVGPSASAQTSATSYPGVTVANGTNINVLSPRGHDAAQKVAGQTMTHAWYFFQVPSTGIWYIVNLNGSTTIVYRLHLKPDNSDYDWLQVSTPSWTRAFSATASSMTITLSER